MIATSYCPQTKLREGMFSEGSVCLQGGALWPLPMMHWILVYIAPSPFRPLLRTWDLDTYPLDMGPGYLSAPAPRSSGGHHWKHGILSPELLLESGETCSNLFTSGSPPVLTPSGGNQKHVLLTSGQYTLSGILSCSDFFSYACSILNLQKIDNGYICLLWVQQTQLNSL